MDDSITLVSLPFSDTEHQIVYGNFGIVLHHIILASSHFSPYSLIPRSDDVFLKAASPESKCDLIEAYQKVIINPHNWTILHLLAISEPETISLVAFYSNMKVPFLLDKYDKTPLHYIVASERLNYPAANIMLKYILDHLEDRVLCSTFERNKVLDSLTPCFTLS